MGSEVNRSGHETSVYLQSKLTCIDQSWKHYSVRCGVLCDVTYFFTKHISNFNNLILVLDILFI